MGYQMKRACRPSTILLIIGFTVSLTAVFVGISTINTILPEQISSGTDLPILQTMRNTGFTLSISIYLFSILNSFAVTNYWIITKRQNYAIRKAFGWTNSQLIGLIRKELTEILLISFILSSCVLMILSHMGNPMLSIRLTPAFIVETIVLLLITLLLSMIVPTWKMVKIEPAEVISL